MQEEKVTFSQSWHEEWDRMEQASRAAAKKTRKKRLKKAACIAFLACVCAAVGLFIAGVIVPQIKYSRASKLLDEGNYSAAIPIFSSLGDYRLSEERLELCRSSEYGEKAWARVKNIAIGDTLPFGRYEQDGAEENGPEAIDWIVLDKDEMSLFLISRNALWFGAYQKGEDKPRWESSALRKWLNEDFLSAAFTEEERGKLKETEIHTAKKALLPPGRRGRGDA
jgi:hypothetical protein